MQLMEDGLIRGKYTHRIPVETLHYARASSLLSACLTETKKEGSRLPMSMFASLRICPSLSVPEVACQGGAALSFVCVSGSPGPHGSQEGRIC